MMMQSDAAAPAKKTYLSPALQRLGDMRDLTAGGSNRFIPEGSGDTSTERQKPG